MKTKNKGSCTSAISRATMSPCNEKRNTESGRSMVEMLGVLAVMGVLTIGGIAGFNYAMNKQRANTLLNEASKRAVVVTGQINMLGYTPSLQEFTNNRWGYGAFENTVYGADGTAGWTKADKQFTLSVTGVSEGVCAQMQKAVAKPIQSFQPETCAAENNTVKLTYNNDMSAEEQVPAGPSCPAGTSETGVGGYATTLADGGMCYCETSGTVYKDGTCESKGDDNTCSSYADCNKGEYCQFRPNYSCAIPTSGTCQSVTPCGLYNIGTNYKASEASGTCRLDWWTAQDVCASLNMRMVSLSDVGCEDYKGDSCPTDGTVYGALRTNGLKYGFWTADIYDSCFAWDLDGHDRVSQSFRPESSGFLCVR